MFPYPRRLPGPAECSIYSIGMAALAQKELDRIGMPISGTDLSGQDGFF